MNLKRYQNEITIGTALLVLLFAYFYKEIRINHYNSVEKSMQAQIDSLNQTIALKKLWDDARTAKSLEKLKALVPQSQITWKKKSSQLDVTYSNITPDTLNRISKIVLNLGVQIKKFDFHKEGTSYTLELVCKW